MDAWISFRSKISGFSNIQVCWNYDNESANIRPAQYFYLFNDNL